MPDEMSLPRAASTLSRALAVRQQLRPPAGALLCAPGADRRQCAAPDQAEPAAGAAARPRSRDAGLARRRRGRSPATALPDGAEPIALAYAGHQFGNFVPQLGDGRAVLLGEVVDITGTRRDIQLKGSGPTPFSRRGDGRAALGPVLREYLISEAMHALGIPTTRSLAAVTTGEPRLSRDRPARRRADPRGVEPHPGRHLPVLRRARRRRGAAAARRPRDRPPLSGRVGLSRPLREGDRAPGRAGRALAAGRLHPRRDEHRQRLDRRRDDRLRPVRLHGRLQSRDGVQLDRPARPLRLRQAAADRRLEHGAARRGADAAVLRRPGRGAEAGERSRCKPISPISAGS